MEKMEQIRETPDFSGYKRRLHELAREMGVSLDSFKGKLRGEEVCV
jgi:hypothetical protein